MSNRSLQSERTGWAGFVDSLTFWRVTIGILIICIFLVATIIYSRARMAQGEYQAAVGQVSDIQEMATGEDVYGLSRDELVWLEDEFVTLEGRIDRIDELAGVPLGLESVLGSLPWVSDRYDAVQTTLELGRMLSEAGQIVANIGTEAVEALEDTGIRHDPENDGVTWLDVLRDRESELDEALDLIDSSREMRAGIDDEYLPQRIVDRLDQIDEVMREFDEQLELADQRPLGYTALGAESPQRYLVLFQNPAELRPTGGFVGTIAEVELHRGQISRYEFHDVYQLSLDYRDSVEEPIDPPWAVDRYLRTDGLQIQDANWWADFPKSSEMLIDMSAVAGWDKFDGVVAVQPETIQDLMAVTGPITVDVDGEAREITSDNLLEEAERQRRLQREGVETETGHKEVVELIGDVLLEQLSRGDRDDMIESLFILFDAMDRRDMQAYHSDEDVQTFVEVRNWAGRMQPDEDTPTIAPIFANITGLKTSLAMKPEMNLELLSPVDDGEREAILTLSLDNLGAEEGDPFYEGFQRWWLDLTLPTTASVVTSTPEAAADPDASNGGSFIVAVPSEERREVVTRFTFDDTERLLLRRQPGLRTMEVTVETGGCDDPVSASLEEDILLDIENECPRIVRQDEE